MWSHVCLRKHHQNKARGGGGIPVEQFQILKDDAVKVLHPICQQIWKTQPWPQDWKRSVFIPMSKDAQTILQFLSFHILVRLCSESFKLGFSIASEAKVDVFLEFPCFFYDSTDVGNLISGSSAFSKSSLYIWKFSVHVLLKSSLEDFEHKGFTSLFFWKYICNECRILGQESFVPFIPSLPGFW